MELAVVSNFHHRRPHRGNLEPLDPKLDALITRPRIHNLLNIPRKLRQRKHFSRKKHILYSSSFSFIMVCYLIAFHLFLSQSEWHCNFLENITGMKLFSWNVFYHKLYQIFVVLFNYKQKKTMYRKITILIKKDLFTSVYTKVFGWRKLTFLFKERRSKGEQNTKRYHSITKEL